jgi:hypothetical protein
VPPRQMGLKKDFCPKVGRFLGFTLRYRTSHWLGVSTSEFKVSRRRTFLRLAENPGSNRHWEAILSSWQSWDIPEIHEKNGIFADFGI